MFDLFDIFIFGAVALTVGAGLRMMYVIRRENKEREERHRLAMKRLEDMKREFEEKARKANSVPITKQSSSYNSRDYSSTRVYRNTSDTRQMSSDDDSLATTLLMNNIMQNNMPVFVDTTPSYSYSSSSSSDDSCSRSSYSYSSSDSYSSSSYDSGSSDSGSSSSCD